MQRVIVLLLLVLPPAPVRSVAPQQVPYDALAVVVDSLPAVNWKVRGRAGVFVLASRLSLENDDDLFGALVSASEEWIAAQLDKEWVVGRCDEGEPWKCAPTSEQTAISLGWYEPQGDSIMVSVRVSARGDTARRPWSGFFADVRVWLRREGDVWMFQRHEVWGIS